MNQSIESKDKRDNAAIAFAGYRELSMKTVKTLAKRISLPILATVFMTLILTHSYEIFRLAMTDHFENFCTRPRFHYLP